MMSNNNTLLKVQDLELRFGRLIVLNKVGLEVKKGEILSIIGPNGAGKTSFINCISGFYRPQEGSIAFNGRDITHLPAHRIAWLGIARTFQNIALYTHMSVLDNLLAGGHMHLKSNPLAQVLYFPWAHREEVKYRAEVVEDILDFLEMKPLRKKIVGTLPYGLRKRVELGRALAMKPQILLLDEPMAGMNLEEKEDMARFILDANEERGMTVVLIEHDMGVVMDISDRVVVLDFGEKIAEGTPEEIKVQPRVIKAYLGEEL